VVFFVSVHKVQNIDKNACRQMFKSLKPFRKEVAVDEPGKDNTIVVLKFFISHQKYQHQESLQDLGIPSMIIDQFWEDDGKDHNEFEYGKSLVTKQVHAKLIWPLRRLHEWYYPACVCGLQFIEGGIPEAVFKSRSFDINIKIFDLHTIDRLRMLDIIMMTVMCTLVYTCDEEKRLGFLNPTQINQFEKPSGQYLGLRCDETLACRGLNSNPRQF
jgi:hypothetical protein